MLIEKNSLILAPMAGVTDYVYRKLCTQFGAQATVTEMVSAKGYILTPREREDVIQLRQTSEGERCALQIFGSDAQIMGQAAQRLCEERFFALDGIERNASHGKLWKRFCNEDFFSGRLL